MLGAQWGDEGKGKIVDILAEHYDVIARACGGANAGHTIVVDGKKYVFHLLPAGSLYAGKTIVLGAGMVVHVPTLLEEIQTLERTGISIRDRLLLSSAAHIVFDYHRAIDAILEEQRTKEEGEAIGTTKRGIGPAYMDKAARSGLRLEHLLASRETLRRELELRVRHVEHVYGVSVDRTGELAHLEEAADFLRDRIVDVPEFLARARSEDRRILIEGAQGALLDIDHGSYPNVTSSSTTAAGALQGLGIPPRALTSCIGVVKAYCTRVGGGAFPTEAELAAAERLRDRGGEYGATTGRPRRCGWLSLPDLHRAACLNGFTCWNLTKIDVLDTEHTIPVAVSGRKDGTLSYEQWAGWEAETSGKTSFDDLPHAAQDYVRFLEERTGIPVWFIGTGQEREAMIIRPT